MKSLLIVALVGCAFVAVSALIGETQSSGARGKLTCNGKPAKSVTVKMYDEDDLDVDDFMGETKTSGSGEYELKGHTDEITEIEPKINIYHDCEDELTPCQRKITIKIPGSYITKGKSPKKFYDAGSIELSGKFPGESRDCLH
uniref:Transthyretin-like family protein n=1 Tax=Panagrellus redivivus TaxID=6233 RepID=A0A7E4V0T7_PANRE